MRCVSYTRVTSCNRLDAPVYSIAEQNEHIREFAKAKGFSVQKKYSDRVADPECVAEFERMRIDGLNRGFDMLVFDSFWQCGKDVLTIARVLKDSFYPAGIQFAIVQEDYCSAGRERDEVMQYLDSIRERYMSHLAVARMNGNPHMFYVETFGYRYNSEKDMLEIDEESAGVVREIFSKLMAGSTPSEIARDLSEVQRNPGITCAGLKDGRSGETIAVGRKAVCTALQRIRSLQGAGRRSITERIMRMTANQSLIRRYLTKFRNSLISADITIYAVRKETTLS